MNTDLLVILKKVVDFTKPWKTDRQFVRYARRRLKGIGYYHYTTSWSVIFPDHGIELYRDSLTKRAHVQPFITL